MKLSDLSIKKLVKYIIGDSEYTPYLKGSKIIELFNKVGIRDIYKFLEGGLPNRDSRTKYAEKILNKLNGTKKLEDIINEIATLEHFSLDKKLNRDVAVKEINKIISNDGYKLEKFNEKYKIIGKDIEDEIKVTPYFEEIQQVIIERLEKAEFTIWIAVAWLTNEKIIETLKQKKDNGISIRIILIGDNINEKYLSEMRQSFEIKIAEPQGYYKNIMHNKYCIIDSKIIINGSYNWTKKANYNNETITINESKELAEKFLKNFMNIWKEN